MLPHTVTWHCLLAEGQVISCLDIVVQECIQPRRIESGSRAARGVIWHSFA